MRKVKISKIESVGQKNTYDIWNRAVNVEEPNFIANGLIVHNSIPKALENRDNPTESWREDLRKMHPIFEEVLGSTLGILCFHEESFVLMADGIERCITDVKNGDEVFSINKETFELSTNIVECCGPTRFGKGIKVTLSNKYRFIVTPDHRIPTFCGDKRADELEIDSDLIGIPNILAPNTAEKITGDISWVRIKKVEEIDDLYFWNLSVANDHTVIVNGVFLNQCYQEQLTALWQRIGGFSASEAQAARKDIAKKRVNKIGKIREMWIKGAQKIMGVDGATKYFDETMLSFGSYAFNKCLYSESILADVLTGEEDTVEGWYSRRRSPHLKSYDGNKTFIDKCVEIHDTGIQEVFEIEFENGKKEFVTMDHRFLCSDGNFYAVRDIIKGGLDITEIDVG